MTATLLLNLLNQSGQARPSLQKSDDRTAATGFVGRQSDGNPIRVLAIVEANTVGGAVKPILEFAREAALTTSGRTAEVTMVLYARARQENTLIDAVRAQGIPIEIVTERHPFDLRAIPQLREIVRRQQPDIIWTNNTKSHFLVCLCALHRTAKWIAFHHGYTKEAFRTRVYDELDRWSLPHAERVVTVCNDFANQLQRKGVARDRLLVQRNPIRIPSPVTEAEKIRLRAALGLASTASVLLSVGRLSLEKGHADLLRALAQMQEEEGAGFHSHLLIVGDGPERSHLHALCSELRLNDIVHFTGYQSDVLPYYALSDVFVLPSHSEGNPNVLLEAMAAGVPTVATAVGGVPEILTHEVNALLVPKHDIAQLANAIRRLLNDPLLRDQIASKAREDATQHHPQGYFRSVMGIFEEVIVVREGNLRNAGAIQ